MLRVISQQIVFGILLAFLPNGYYTGTKYVLKAAGVCPQIRLIATAMITG